MGVAEDSRVAFAKAFNEILGNKIGRPHTELGDRVLGPMYDSAQYMKKPTTNSGTSSEELGKLISDTLRQQQQIQATQGSNHSKGWFNDGFDGFKMNALKLVSRPLDISSRPAYGVFSALENTMKALNEGQNPVGVLDDALYGAGQGLGGYNKAGYGDFVEEAFKYDPENKDFLNRLIGSQLAGIGQGPVPFAKEALAPHTLTDPKTGETIESPGMPGLYKWYKRGVGLQGDLTLDPTAYATGGTILSARSAIKNAAESGTSSLIRRAAKEAGRTGTDVVRESVEKNVRNALQDSALQGATRQLRSGNRFVSGTADVIDDIVHGTLSKLGNIAYDINAGAQKGKTIMGPEVFRTVAQSAAELHRAERLKALRTLTNKFLGKDSLGKLSAKELQKMLAENPTFKTFYEAFTDGLSKGGSREAAREAAENAVAETLQKETDEIFNRVLGGIEDEFIKVPTLRVLGKNIVEFPKAGELLNTVGKKVGSTGIGRAIKAFNWTSAMPGYSSLISQKARALGSAGYEDFRHQVWDAFHDVSKEDKKILHKAREAGETDLGSTFLNEKLAKLKEFYDQIYDREVKAGLRRDVAKNKMDNYVYTYLKGKKVDRDQFLDVRKKAIAAGQFTTDENGIAGAVKKGLKPETDAVKNLLFRAMKSNRQLTKHYFFKDLASHYGVKGVLTPLEASRRGLTAIPEKEIANDIKSTLKGGEKLYIDKDIQEIKNYYNELLTPGSRESEDIVRAWDYVTRQFKTLNTIYFPAFHIRNFISDMFMGALDGVGISDYRKVFKGWKSFNLKHDLETQIDLGGQTIKWKRLKDAFDENASSGGFFPTDIPNRTGGRATGLKSALDPRDIPANARKFSESREDFGRFSHFYHAMNEEYPAALKKYKNPDKAWDAAVNASVFRVNKYKFDYGALTKTEQRFMRRGIPFYTYTRKAIPTLTEAMFLSPRNLSYTNRLFEQMGFDQNEYPLIPDWMREMGFAQISGGDEPTGISENFLPQNTFNDLFTNPAAQLNPLIRAPFELKNGKDTFSGRPVNGLQDLLYNNLRLSQYMPPAVSPGDQQPKIWNPDVSPIEKLGMVLGIPAYTVTKERQAQALQERTFNLKGDITKINESAHANGYHVYYSDSKTGGTKIKIRRYDPANPDKKGDDIGEFKTYEEAMKALERLTQG